MRIYIKCYMKRKSDPEIGYTDRMKKLWEEIHPELTFSSGKNLRDQASRVKKKNRVVMETEHRLDEKQNNSNVANDDSTEENSNVKSEHLTINNTLIVNTNCRKSRA